MRLKTIKNKAKWMAIIVVGAIPALASLKAKMVDAYMEGNGYPQSLEEYENWIGSASVEQVQEYNDVLFSLRSNESISLKFLDQWGYDSASQFKSHLTSLYEQGKAGDLSAQEQFNAIYSSYQDDFFAQTTNYLFNQDSYIESVQSMMDVGAQSIFDNIPPEILMGVGAAGAALCSYIIYKRTKNNKELLK